MNTNGMSTPISMSINVCVDWDHPNITKECLEKMWKCCLPVIEGVQGAVIITSIAPVDNNYFYELYKNHNTDETAN